MMLDLNTSQLRSHMDLWRDMVDMKIPLSRAARKHFFEERGSLLEGFSKTATTWLLLLQASTVRDEDHEEHQALIKAIEEFRSWAMVNLVELRILKAQALAGDD